MAVIKTLITRLRRENPLIQNLISNTLTWSVLGALLLIITSPREDIFEWIAFICGTIIFLMGLVGIVMIFSKVFRTINHN